MDKINEFSTDKWQSLMWSEFSTDFSHLQLHDTYTKICRKRQIAAIDYSEYQGICTLVESRGIVGIKKNKDSRFAKVGTEFYNIKDSRMAKAGQGVR